VDVEIIIRKHHLPHAFPDEVLDEAARVARPVTQADVSRREDFRHLPIVTIDGETARDFDDAVYLERRASGWHLQVHIADVAHYVRLGGALDLEARLRGTSVYFPDRAVPMLPEALSNDICSLNPRADRLVMSVVMEFDAAAQLISSRLTPGVIRSAERMTYTNVNKVLEGDTETTAQYAALAPHFRDMKELALLLNAQRAARGSIDFDLPEPLIEFDEQQRISAIVRSERNMAHRLIEEFMLAANRAVASYLLSRGIESLHRVHEKPDAKKVIEFEELARAFGYTLGVENLVEQRLPVRHGRAPAPARPGRADSYGRGRERSMFAMLPASGELKITPGHYQRLLAKLAGKPEERIVSYLMLRSLKRARYAADPLGHFALAFEEYTHFTSPIRRYPDLVVHRILKWGLEHPVQDALAKRPSRKAAGRPLAGQDTGPYSRAALEEIAAESSEAERRAEAAERELMDWKTAQFMESHLGEEYDALIISVQKYGFFVELMDVFVEGLVPITSLEEAAGARCAYRQGDHAIVALVASGGRSGRRRAPGSAPADWGRAAKPAYSERSKPGRLAWRLGDRVRVRAERIDPLRRRVEFALAGAL
jgi:ribonuclease R